MPTTRQILQEDHYYPFGLNISALSSTAPLSKPNQFKYNGKELDENFDLGWYHYGARMYDPQLGRFTTIDPLADLYVPQSPYVYAANNPILLVDFNGEGPGKGSPFSGRAQRLKNGDIRVSRITTEARVVTQVMTALIDLNPISAGVKTGVQFYNMANYNGETDVVYETVAQEGTRRIGLGLDDIQNDPDVDVKSKKTYNRIGKAIGAASKGYDIFNVFQEITNNNPTKSETLEGFSFFVASRAGKNIDSPVGAEGRIIDFNGDNYNEATAEKTLNTIYEVIQKALDNFDLTNKDDIRAANSYLRTNFNDLIKSINQRLEEDKDEKNKD